MIHNNLAGFTLTELLSVIMLVGIVWAISNLTGSEIQKTITAKTELEQLKLEFEKQISYANITKEKIQIIPENIRLKVIGNKFIYEIPLKNQLLINSNEHQLNFHPRQVCSPASISSNANKSCHLIISLRCRMRIQC